MDLSSIALQGMHQAEAELQTAAAKLADAGAAPADASTPDTVNLSAEMVALMSAQAEYSGNLNTLKTADQIHIDVTA